MLLGGLNDGGEIDAAEALQLLDFFGHLVKLTQDLFQQLLALLLAKLWLLLRYFGILDCFREQTVACVAAVFLILLTLFFFCLWTGSQWLELLLTGGCAVAQLLRDLDDEVVHLLELHVGELVDEGTLVLSGPAVVILIVLEELFQLVIVDILGPPWRINAFAEGTAEFHCSDRSELLESTNYVELGSARATRNGTKQLQPQRSRKTSSAESLRRQGS